MNDYVTFSCVIIAFYVSVTD